MLQNSISGREKSWLLRPRNPETGRWLCFTTVHLPHLQNNPWPQISLSPDEPGILSILRNKYSHVYVGETVLESRKHFILLTSLKYFHSMDFDSHCSQLRDLALSETISRSLWKLKCNFSKCGC